MNEARKKLIILGAGNFAEEVLEIVLETGDFEVSCFAEGLDRKNCGKSIAGIPVVWVDDLVQYDTSHLLLCGIGSPKRKNIVDQIAAVPFKFATVIHPTSHISPTVRMGKDVLIGVGSILATGSTLGDHVIFNRAVVAGHHVSIGSYVTLSPGVNIGGGSSIGEAAFIGMGAIILDHISVGSHSIVGAGAVVTRDVPDYVQVLGIPARVTKTLVKEEL
jgi:acetyltransferase EpsM